MTTGWVLTVVSYLMGSIPSAYLFARIKGIDIRTVGSGNVGASNVFRCVGKGWGTATLLADFVKGFVPAFFFPMLARDVGDAGGAPLAVACACAAVAGHNWPVFLKFKGGKGVATSGGALLGLAPAAMGASLAVWVAALLLTHFISVASIAAALAAAACGWIWYRTDGLLIPVVLTLFAASIVWRHRSNLQRLRQGTENRVGWLEKRNKRNPS